MKKKMVTDLARCSRIVSLAALSFAFAANAKLLPVEVYEKGGGDVDCSSRYLIRERVREVPGVKCDGK